MVKYGGIDALRLSYLYDGTPKSKSNLQLPALEIFIDNDYKKYAPIPKVAHEKILGIVSENYFRNIRDPKHESVISKSLFGLISLTNHSQNGNVV